MRTVGQRISLIWHIHRPHIHSISTPTLPVTFSLFSTHPRAWTSRLQRDAGRRSTLTWWRRLMSLLAVTRRTRCRGCCLRWLRYMISRQWFWNCLQCRTHRRWHSLTERRTFEWETFYVCCCNVDENRLWTLAGLIKVSVKLDEFRARSKMTQKVRSLIE